MLSLENVWRGKPQPAEDRFRVVLCWLENDPDGDNMRNVAQAFTSIEGVTLVRSADIVAASGAADDWREAMQREARSVLEGWDADLAVVGLVSIVIISPGLDSRPGPPSSTCWRAWSAREGRC